MKLGPSFVKGLIVMALASVLAVAGPALGGLAQELGAQAEPKAGVDPLLKEVLAATQAEGDEAVRRWMKANKGRVRAEWIEHLAQQGTDGHDGKLVKIAVLLAEEKGDVRCLADTYLAAGDCDQAGNAASALSFYGKALDLFEKMKDLAGQGKADFGEGMAYSLSGRLQMALQSFNRALTLRRALGDRAGEGDVLHKIGNTYLGLGEARQALEHYELALSIRRAVGDQRRMAATLNNMGLAHSDLHEARQAVDCWAQALPIFHAAGDLADEGAVLNNIGVACLGLGELRQALEYDLKALPIFRALADRAHEASTLSTIGLIDSDLGEPRTALEFFNQALVIYRARGDRTHEASSLYNMGVAHFGLGEWREALEIFTQVLPIFRALGDRAGEAVVLRNIGTVDASLGDARKALENLNQALQIERAIGGRADEAITLTGIGAVYSGLGEQRKALEQYEQALAIEQAVGDHAGEAETLQDMGVAYYRLSEWPRALDCYSKALPIFRALGDRGNEARVLTDTGNACLELGQKQRALEYYTQALPIFRSLGDRASETAALGDIATAYFDLGEKQKALDYYTQALPIFRAIGDRFSEAATLGDMGNVYSDLGERSKALECHRQSLSISRAIGDRAGEAASLGNIGTVCFELGERRKALQYFEQALPIARGAGDRGDEAKTLNNMGSVYFELGDRRRAVEYYNQALLIHRAIGNRGFEADTDYHLMRAWEALSKPRLAVLCGKEAVNLCQELRANIQGLDKETQRAYLRTVERVYRELADVLAGQGRLWEAEEVLGLLKEEEYFEYVRRDSATAKALGGRADLTPAEAAALARYEGVADKVGGIGRRVEELRKLRVRTADQEAELERLNKDLEAAGKTFGVVLREIEDELGGSRGARDVVEELRATKGLGVDLRRLNVAVLSTVVGEKSVWVILTTPTAQVAGRTDIAEGELDRKVLTFREALQEPGTDPRPLGRQLYGILVKPVEKELAAASPGTVAWMLDGTLRYLPVAALFDGERYVAERFASVELTRASLSRLALEPSEAWRALGLGVSEAEGGFSALPKVAEELRAVVREGSGESGVLPGVRRLNGEFTRKALEESREAGYQVIHIASHFDFNPGTTADSFLLLGDGNRLTLEEIRTEPEPLFAGVELLTLSACNTALGAKQADGREVDGLGDEAQNLGAEAVLATLWPVADESTAELMAGFYRLKAQGLSKAEALRQAQLALLRGSAAPLNAGSVRGAKVPESPTPRPYTAGYSHPYYWAPFILIGNWK